jgi:hypothetical protein
MVRDEGGRWDVSTEEDEVYVERIADGEQEYEDWLSPDEARALAGLLMKYADEAEKWVDEDDVDYVDAEDAEWGYEDAD